MTPLPNGRTRHERCPRAATLRSIVSARTWLGGLAVCAFLLLPAAAPAGDAVTSRASGGSSLFISPVGSDLGRCTRAQPCAGFDRAYGVASPGTTIYVAAGRYGAERIQARPGRGRPRVVIRPLANARVSVTGELTVAASHLELRDMTLNDLEIPREATDVTFRNIRNHGFWMQGPTNISFVGGEVSCGACSFHPHIDDGGPPDFRPPRDIVFDGVQFHDWQAAAPDQHTECLQILAGDGITIRNSVFRNCATANDGRGATANLQISWLGNGPKTRNILIENNFFYRSGNLYAIQSGDWQNLRFRFNSIAGPILIGGGWGDGTPVEVVGNILQFSGCQAARTGTGPVAPLEYRHNVLDGGTCSSTDVDAPNGFVDARTNLRLRAGAAAIGRGDPASYPMRDIDGDRRPLGGRPDAGADERR
jgi:hypothetical protein